MKGRVVVLSMLGASKKQFTEWDEAIFLVAFQVFENAITEEPGILSRFGYKCERELATKLGYVKNQRRLRDLVNRARNLLKWWMKYKKQYSGDYRTLIASDSIQSLKLKELAEILPILWD